MIYMACITTDSTQLTCTCTLLNLAAVILAMYTHIVRFNQWQ